MIRKIQWIVFSQYLIMIKYLYKYDVIYHFSYLKSDKHILKRRMKAQCWALSVLKYRNDIKGLYEVCQQRKG